MSKKLNLYPRLTRSIVKKIKVTKNGPYLVSNDVPLDKEKIAVDNEGYSEKWQKVKDYPSQKEYALCRCGQSKNPPFCDGSHHKSNFDGVETAGFKKFDDIAEIIDGPSLILKDAQQFCASGRFCDRNKGTWQAAIDSDEEESRQLAINQCGNCHSGRLVAIDKRTGESIEPKFEQSISVTEDPEANASGPLWVKGNMQIESVAGKKYELRNRVTLCRCGKSSNKPFCDTSHISAQFNDGEISE